MGGLFSNLRPFGPSRATAMLHAGTIVKGYFKRGYAGDVAQQAGNVVQATLRTYREAEPLLPTFSVKVAITLLTRRDFSRVVQAVVAPNPAAEFQNKPSVMRLGRIF